MLRRLLKKNRPQVVKLQFPKEISLMRTNKKDAGHLFHYVLDRKATKV